MNTIKTQFSALMKAAFILALAFWSISNTQAQDYFNGFETGVAPGWDAFGAPFTPTRVASGTNGITSATGAWHAEVAGNAATDLGGYNSTFPTFGFNTSLDIYLDISGGWANDTRFDYICAISNTAGGHRRDFAFNLGFYNDGTGPGAGTDRYVVSASNNAGRASSFPKNPGRSPIAISGTGWYTFVHNYYDAGAGVLAVDLEIYDNGGMLVGSWTLSDPSDIIGTTVGGNRYSWVANNEFSFLAIDNSAKTDVPPPCSTNCPTISQTNANDPTSFDPCSCGDPLNYYDADGDITFFHDFVEVTSMTGETWEVTAVSAQAYSDDGVTNIIVGDVLTETPPGSGVYRIDLFHPPGVGFTMTVDRTAGGPSFPLMEGGTCVACKQVPTLGQWGLIILSLLILTFGVVVLRSRETALAVAGTNTISTPRRLPFNGTTFRKMLVIVMAGLAVVFAVAVGLFGYEMTTADVPGSLVAGPMLAYLLHLLVSEKK